MQAAVTVDTTSSAARKLGIREQRLRDLEARGLVGPFQRDAAGRRLLGESDIASVRLYLEQQVLKAA